MRERKKEEGFLANRLFFFFIQITTTTYIDEEEEKNQNRDRERKLLSALQPMLPLREKERVSFLYTFTVCHLIHQVDRKKKKERQREREREGERK